nr:hypothetical protein [Mesotoga prima]
MKKVFLVLVLIGLVFTGFSKNIVEVAVSAGNFSTLVAAVEKAGLVETLIEEMDLLLCSLQLTKHLQSFRKELLKVS